jgi:hypothetical protein
MCILVVRGRPLIGPLIGHFTYYYDTRCTQDLKPVNGAKTSNATDIGQSTIGLASEPKPNINEKQSNSEAPKTVAQARAHWACVLPSPSTTYSIT